MSLFVNVLFQSIDNGILNNLGPIHYPNVDGTEPVLLREMACDSLCIGLFPEPALILSFNLHLNEPFVTAIVKTVNKLYRDSNNVSAAGLWDYFVRLEIIPVTWPEC